MRKFLLSIILINLNCVVAQTPPWQWAKNASSSGDELAWDVAYDGFSGNTYVGGYFDGNLSAVYGASFNASYGANDGFIAKYDPNGNVVWAIKIGGSNDEEVKSIATDNLGDVYVTGYFKSVCDFDPSGATFNLTPNGGAGNQDGFLAKYSSTGAFLWAIKFGDSGDEDAWRLYADANGIYLTGSYNGYATFYSTNATTKSTTASNQLTEFFGAKYNSSGVVQWVISGASNKEDNGYDIVADAANVYFTGIYSHDMDIYDASGTFVSQMLQAGSNKPNVFIIAMTQAGAYAWSTNVSSSDDDYGYGIAQDAGNLYITGSIKATADFKYPGPQFTKTVVGGTDIFIAKIAKLTGDFLWVSSQTGSDNGDEAGYALNVDANNNLIVTGYFENTLNFSSYSGPNLSSSGNEDLFVSAFNISSGNYLWVKQGIGSGKEGGHGVAVSSTGGIYVAGEYGNALTLGTFTLPTGSNNNIFIAKIGCEIATNNIISASQTICAGSTPSPLTGSVPFGGNVYTWQMSANNLTWTNATGTFTNQNYNPPTLTATTYYQRNIIVIGTCTNVTGSAIVTITVNQQPTASNAGITQTVCGATATLNGNAPTAGIGTWFVITGTGIVTNTLAAQSVITSLTGGMNKFVWIIKNGVCPQSQDTLMIISDLIPSDALAGSDLQACSNQITHSAITPLVGTGTWTIISGNCSLTNVGPNSIQINMPTSGVNILRFTVKNGICPDKTDDIMVTRFDPPSIADAGTDQTIETSLTKLNAIAPTTGMGKWSIIEGNAEFSDVNNAISTVNKLAVGNNILRWTTYNGNCPENTDDILVYVKPLVIPNGFSPNGDGFNDKFIITSLDYYEQVKFSVFNRWGALVYSNNNYKNDWSGTNSNNEKLVDDTYYYLLEMPTFKNFTGFIIIKQNK